MNLKYVSYIEFLLGSILVIYGCWHFYGYIIDDSAFNYISVMSIFAGLLIIYVSLNNVWIFNQYAYRKEIKLFYIVVIILIIPFLYLVLSGFNIHLCIVYLFIYIEFLIMVLWFFIRRCALDNKDKIANHVFEFIFFISLFIATMFVTFAIGKMSVLGWSMLDVEVLLYFCLLFVCYVCAIMSGIIHYIDGIG